MSLINQALHKAQRDRTPNRMAQAGEQSSAAYASSAARGMSPKLVIGLIIAVAVLIGLVVGLSVVIFKDDSTPAQQVAASTAPTPTAPAAAASPAPLTSPIAQAATPAASNTEATSAAPSVVDELRKAREAAEADARAQAEAEAKQAVAAAQAAALEAQAAAAASARAAAKPSEDIITWLGRAKLSGVKISETESKVILNGKAYAVGQFVNFKLGLKVMVIQEKRVLFVDNNGKKYMKRL